MEVTIILLHEDAYTDIDAEASADVVWDVDVDVLLICASVDIGKNFMLIYADADIIIIHADADLYKDEIHYVMQMRILMQMRIQMRM